MSTIPQDNQAEPLKQNFQPGPAMGGPGAAPTMAAGVPMPGAGNVPATFAGAPPRPYAGVAPGRNPSETFPIYFVASFCILFSGVFAFLDLLFSLEGILDPADFIDSAYLCIFGAVMCILDVPVQVPGLVEPKRSISKYCLFLTRLTGRGLAFMFFSTMILGALWDNNASPTLGFFLGPFVFLLGLYTLVVAAQRSSKLENCRQKLRVDAKSRSYAEIWKSYASEPFTLGLKPDEFQKLAHARTHMLFDAETLGYIYRAVLTDPDAHRGMTEGEFQAWLDGGMVYL